MLPFHHGAATMAIKTKTPIVPIMIYKKPRFFRMAHIIVGEPIELTEYYDRKLTTEEVEEADNKVREIMLGILEDHRIYLENKKKKRGNLWNRYILYPSTKRLKHRRLTRAVDVRFVLYTESLKRTSLISFSARP